MCGEVIGGGSRFGGVVGGRVVGTGRCEKAELRRRLERNNGDADGGKGDA